MYKAANEITKIVKTRRPSTSRASARIPAGIASCINLGNILVPVDFSPESRQAVRYGAAFATQFNTSLTLLHVVELLAFTVDVGYGPVKRLVPNEIMLRNTTVRLKRLKRRLASSGLKVGLVVRSGVAHSEIVQAAALMKADLIVMGHAWCYRPGCSPWQHRGKGGAPRSMSGNDREKEGTRIRFSETTPDSASSLSPPTNPHENSSKGAL